jgi:outer membrane lipase/esterase
MTSWKYALSALGAALVVAGCGGGGGATSGNPVGFTSIVSFGDSLSDTGTHAVGTVAALGGGRYTINSGSATAPSKIWLDLISNQLGLPAPCSAMVGLESSAPFGAPVAITTNPACTNYAQGGSRVTNPIGPANKALPAAAGGAVGQLTIPVVTQIANHLATTEGVFSGKELVTVLAGGNDVFFNGNAVSAAVGGGAGAAGAAFFAGWTAAEQAAVLPGGAAAQGAAVTAAVTTMGIAGGTLAAAIKTSIVGKGAKRVLVLNLPDVASSPYGIENPAAVPIVNAMVQTFNQQLAAGLAGVAGVTIADTYTVSRDQFTNPAAYGISNSTQRACSTDAARNPLGGASILCSPANLNAGDVSRYGFADDVHPTPYGHQLIAQFAAKIMAGAGWL